MIPSTVRIFVCKLSVSIRGERYTEDVGCLGERKHAFEVLDTAEISFLPEP